MFAFSDCTELASVTFGDNSQLRSIEEGAFMNCPELKSIEIPYSVNSIGEAAFAIVIVDDDYYAQLDAIFLPDNGLTVGYYVIFDTTTQVKYSLNNNKATITEIKLGEEKNSVVIPETICGYEVVAVADAYQQYVDKTNHTCTDYVWTGNESQYWEECAICGKEKEGTRKDLPVIIINAPDQVCRTQDAVVSVSLPEGFTNAALYHEFSHSGGEIDLDATDGLNGQVSHESYKSEENSLKFVVYATTSDGYSFKVTKTVEILDNHILKHISAKDATVTEEGNKEYWQCTVCEKYFSDENGTNEISFEEIVISKLAPEIINGKGQSVTQGTKKALSFTSNASIDDFICVKLDGKELDEKNYTVKSGSIVVTLKSDFVSTLKVGKHTISIVSETGEASTEFEVVKKEVVKDSSKKDSSNKTNTGIIGNAGLWISMMASSINAMLIGFVLKKKKS